MSGKVLVFGSLALDSIETPFGKRKNILGGSATHAALSASYFTTPLVVTAVGEDFPDEHTKFLKTKFSKLFNWKKSKLNLNINWNQFPNFPSLNKFNRSPRPKLKANIYSDRKFTTTRWNAEKVRRGSE